RTKLEYQCHTNAVTPAGPPMRLKEWLIAQVESGGYPGLCWEDREKKEFRIPWKHAAKQHYRQQEDAALFKAWAIYKGKYHEGVDKADPSVWKTRLRCALNKSIDFKEVPDRSHLDISEPYKVYQIVTDHSLCQRGTTWHTEGPTATSSNILSRVGKVWRDTFRAGKAGWADPGSDGVEGSFLPPPSREKGSRTLGEAGPLGAQAALVQLAVWREKYFWLHIRLYYCDVLVKEVTTRTAEGCRITYRPVPADNEHLYGPSAMEQVQFPCPGTPAGDGPAARVAGVLERLLPHLHRGILLWVAPEGVFTKRQCQGRVYWKGPLAPHEDRPNKLERERTYKLLDTQQFLQQLRGFLNHGKPPPQYQIHFCFGEEYPAAPNQKLHKFVTACVEPVFARDLCLHAQRLGPQSLQGPQPLGSDAPRNIVQILKQLCSP
uniref:IRF tryptophan pentad repeat domain-containing protein n=1 Tax=Varanus komodoensis TaxID=61221 RepID=A0A8D2L459_VARKO